MTTTSAAGPDLTARRTPSLGGFNLTALRLEVRRLLRNRRTVIIAMVFPAFFFLIFGLNVLGLASVVVVYAVGAFTGKPSMPAYLWIVTGLCVWIGSLVFAAFGLFMGYLLPTENVMQLLSFALVIFAFGGGLFIPLSQYPHVLQTLATYTPLFGLNELTHAPLLGGSINISWVANALAWLVIFAGGAIWRFRKDTARV